RTKWAPGPTCEPGDSAGVVRALESAIGGAGERPVLVLGRHPLASGGRHGGRFGWRDHFFPLTDRKGWVWLPCPILGAAYPGARVGDRRGGGAPRAGAGASSPRVRRAARRALRLAAPSLPAHRPEAVGLAPALDPRVGLSAAPDERIQRPGRLRRTEPSDARG